MPDKNAKRRAGKKHIVVFQDEAGNVLKTALVAHGDAAVPPKVPVKIPLPEGEAAHYEMCLKGWNGDVSHVVDNLVVRAVYEKVPKQYLVMYFHENGKPIATETVLYGEAAKQGCFPEKPSSEEFEYVFDGWDTDLSRIEKDTVAKAVFRKQRRTFFVRFFHEDGILLKEERVFYGQGAHEPPPPQKEKDLVYHYTFVGWDKSSRHITEETAVCALFSPVYNEYKVRFLERISRKKEEIADGIAPPEKSASADKTVRAKKPKDILSESILIEEKTYHYRERIVYPPLKKKGYTLVWDVHPERVEGDIDIHAHWEFTNPKGKIVSSAGNIFQITNPSVTNGAVCLLSYRSSAVRVKLPEQIRLGDYDYRIEEIGERAFADCPSMQLLCLPDSVRTVKKDGVSGCRQLRTVIFGKNLHSIEEKAFRGTPRLKKIVFSGKNLRKISSRAWEGMGSRVEIDCGDDLLFSGRFISCGNTR